jgi:hypothetical protein
MNGQMGNVRVTVRNLDVVRVERENNLLLGQGRRARGQWRHRADPAFGPFAAHQGRRPAGRRRLTGGLCRRRPFAENVRRWGGPEGRTRETAG